MRLSWTRLFLTHVATMKGITVDTPKVEAVSNWPDFLYYASCDYVVFGMANSLVARMEISLSHVFQGQVLVEVGDLSRTCSLKGLDFSRPCKDKGSCRLVLPYNSQ